SCEGNTPRLCTSDGSWQNETPCMGLTPTCVGAGLCLCQPGARRCDDRLPQVCGASNQWTNVGAACTNCLDGVCAGEGCTAETVSSCAGFGCACASGACGGAYCDNGDGCTAARRSACSALGCGCVDGGCSGGFCAGDGCTVFKRDKCKETGCGCSLMHCIGTDCASTR
ncbi:MAG TPA: hypothetical protein VK509_11870, partial [Polyangiales bacterium]|nr:hypothetical protein [Polyangiales bacterium]